MIASPAATEKGYVHIAITTTPSFGLRPQPNRLPSHSPLTMESGRTR